MVDFSGGGITNEHSADDVKHADQSIVSSKILFDRRRSKKGNAESEKIDKETAKTIPGRENGGNCDIKNLSRGSKIFLPVFVEGANLSTGDMHFSQDDGEVSFCGAIEMSGFLVLKCEIIRGGMREYLTPMGPTPLHVNPIFEISPVEPRFLEWISGIVDSPNAIATLAIPTAIFDQDIHPKTGKVPVGPRLVRKPDVLRCTYDGNLPTTKIPTAALM
ncbi:hypothetical protein CRYUN_Cryun22dG0089200 [Craigia yunnanensis]